MLDFTQAGIKGQKELNARFIKDHSALFEKVDVSKQKAIKYAFVNSRILLIYGAAGTGKTTLINYISSLMPKSKSFFLLKHMLPFNTFKEELIIQDQILILFVLIVLQEELICQIMILFL